MVGTAAVAVDDEAAGEVVEGSRPDASRRRGTAAVAPMIVPEATPGR